MLSVAAASYSPDQLAFLERKKAAGYGGSSASPTASSSSSDSQGFSPDQLAFLKRREQETGKKWQPPKMDGPEPRSTQYIDRSASETYVSGSSSGGDGSIAYHPGYHPSFHPVL